MNQWFNNMRRKATFLSSNEWMARVEFWEQFGHQQRTRRKNIELMPWDDRER